MADKNEKKSLLDPGYEYVWNNSYNFFIQHVHAPFHKYTTSTIMCNVLTLFPTRMIGMGVPVSLTFSIKL